MAGGATGPSGCGNFSAARRGACECCDTGSNGDHEFSAARRSTAHAAKNKHKSCRRFCSLRHGDEHHTGRAHSARAEEEGASLCSGAKFGQCLRGGAPKFSRTVRKPSAPAVRRHHCTSTL